MRGAASWRGNGSRGGRALPALPHCIQDVAQDDVDPRWTSKAWHVVQTKPRAEWLVHRNLRGLGFDTYYPHYPATVRHGRAGHRGVRVIGVLRPLYPRYVFVGLEAGQWIAGPRALIGVSQIVYDLDEDGDPVTIPAGDMAALAALDLGGASGFGRMAPPKDPERERLPPGSSWEVQGGPFADQVAIVVIDLGDRVRTRVRMFGREMDLIVEPGLLGPVMERRR